MDTAKYKILKDALDNSFDIERFKKFTREFFNGPDMLPATRQTGVWREYDDYVQCYYRIAEYIDENRNKLIILAVELKKGRSVELARSMQRNFVSKILDTYDYNAAIVAFYSESQPNWRLSFVRLDYTLTEKGLDIDLSPARRYSYLVGEDEPKHTAEAQLFPLFKDDQSNPTLDEIEEAFSVERVTDDFFNQYKEKYLQLKEYLENDDKFIKESERLGFKVNKFSEQFSKKLMGQLAFLYFVQKKGWLGVTLLPRDRELLESEYQKIYQSVEEPNKIVLEKYFVKQSGKRRLNTVLLRKEMTNHEADLLSDCFVGTEHDMPWGTGNPRFISELCQYCINNTEENFFNYFLEPFFYEGLNTKRRNDYYKRFNCKIPFLNGGLFEPLEGYHWKDVKFEIPNEIFSNKKNENDRNADGIIDIFDRYNFTINENEPLEKDVAVDPEMLGKIFESLLDISDRKSKGAFYTPREIVHYMCQESLINYLVNEVDVPYEDMREFILYGELLKDVDSSAKAKRTKDYSIKDSVLDNIGEIDKALENVRIADPAVGSGAFPLGMLNEIVKARNNITEYIIIKDKEGMFDRRYGEDFIRNWRSPYKMKLETIKNSIFAVDIEPSAVDIAKLRLWLSIIVDQEIDEEYSKPQPLPNLDSNILVGNSLIDEYEGIKLFDKSILDKHKIGNGNQKKAEPKQLKMDLMRDYTDELLDEMFNLQNRLFEEDNEDKKNQIKREINQIRDNLIIYTLEKNGNHEGLKKYNEFKDEKMKPYFIWELEFARVFQEKGGFDIVIGNPPYIDSEEMTKNLEHTREFCKNKYKSAKGNWDIFVIFIEKGIDLLKCKGTISYIVPNKLIGAKYTETLRKILINYSVHEIRDYSSVEVFREADVYPIVFRLEKSAIRNHVNMSIMESKTSKGSNIFIKPELFYRDIYWDRYMTDNQETVNIIEKLLKGIPLGKVAEVKGSATVSEAYEIKNEIFNFEELKDEKDYKKFINTGTIDRYVSLWEHKNTRYIKDSYMQPVILNDSIEKISKRRFIESSKEKIIIGGMNKYLECYYDTGEYIAGKSTSIIYDSKVSLLYLLGLLNSRLISFYYRNYFKSLSLSGGYLRIGPPQLSKIPIIIDNSRIEEMEKNVTKLIELYNINDIKEIGKYESIINADVYKIYKINEKEIRIIEEKY